jgi:hypothetical protein
MSELQRTMAHDDLARHFQRGESFALEFVRIDFLRTCLMHLHINQRASQIFDRFETLIKGDGFFDFINQILRNRFAGFIMKREFMQNFRSIANAPKAVMGIRRNRGRPTFRTAGECDI